VSNNHANIVRLYNWLLFTKNITKQMYQNKFYETLMFHVKANPNN